ncbi:hypothetical protein LCGC14_2781760, partial [marine sediment metagenome]
MDQLRRGKIPTNRQFELLEPIFGEETVSSLYGELVKKRKFSGWEVPALAVQAGKSIFSLDIQTVRQGRSAAARHPAIFARGAWNNIKAYASKKQAVKIDAELKASEGYKESAKTLNYISTKGYKQTQRLEQFSLGLTERLVNVRFKMAVLDRSAGAGLRTYGRIIAASERGAAAGINKMMKGMWDIGQAHLAQIPNLTLAQKKTWT